MKWIVKGLIVVLALYGLITVGYNLKRSGDPVEPVKTVTAVEPVQAPTIHDLWVLTNKERAKRGLSPLVLDQRLNKSAADKCNDMVKKNYFEHDTPDGKTPWDFIDKYLPNYKRAGENLAKSSWPSSRSVIKDWMNSTAHRDNLLKPAYTNVGFGICTHKNDTLTVQHFIGL